jgi:hypothetical protein
LQTDGRIYSSVFSFVEKNFWIWQKNFKKPIDKRNFFGIIKVQKERTEQKMLGSFKITEITPMNT